MKKKIQFGRLQRGGGKRKVFIVMLQVPLYTNSHLNANETNQMHEWEKKHRKTKRKSIAFSLDFYIVKYVVDTFQ